MPRYLLPATVPLLVLAAATLEPLRAWLVARLAPGRPVAGAALAALAAALVLLPSLALDRALWTDPARAPMPSPTASSTCSAGRRATA